MRILVTGGCGFIGSALVRLLVRESDAEVLNVDALTYAANPPALEDAARSPRYRFAQADIGDRAAMAHLLAEFRPDAVMNLAAETHVDRSIDGPAVFVMTNVVGSVTLLQAVLDHWRGLGEAERAAFRFHHISTDEVFGTLAETDPAFTEITPYDPRSPYSASKAASDHFVRAWHHTYGLPVVISNCSNNYGPWQFPEKLVPLMAIKALKGERLPVYGAGTNRRDWLHVDDHARALVAILKRGRLGESYNVGGDAERTNITVVESICDLVDELAGPRAEGPRRGLIGFVTDRPGHDFRYAMDASRLKAELGWAPAITFESGIRATVAWYLEQRAWWEALQAQGGYKGERLGGVSENRAPAPVGGA